MITFNITTDGACIGNGKEESFGGWAAIIESSGFEFELSGGFAPASNQRAELLAVINAIEYIATPSKLRITTDSKYVLDGYTKWIKGWLRNGWINSKKEPVANRDLWERLLAAVQDGGHILNEEDWTWVKGHSGDPLNERVDQLARTEAERIRIKN